MQARLGGRALGLPGRACRSRPGQERRGPAGGHSWAIARRPGAGQPRGQGTAVRHLGRRHLRGRDDRRHCGSVNCMHDSLNPLAGLTPLTGMWLNCVLGGKGVGLDQHAGLPHHRRLSGRADGGPHARVPGQEGRGPRDETGHAGPADSSRSDPGPTGCSPRPTGARRPTNNPGAARVLGNPLRVHARPRPTTAPASKAWATPTASTTTRPRRRSVRMGHRHGTGDAVQPIHSDHRSVALAAAWPRRSRRRSRPARCAPTR